MGNPSFFSDEELEKVKEKALKKYVDKRIKELTEEGNTDLLSYFNDLKEHIDKTKEFSFSFMNGWKIQSYWYDNFTDFICEISQFIKGVAHFEFETGAPFKIICDLKPKFKAEISTLQWTEEEWEIKCQACEKPIKLKGKFIRNQSAEKRGYLPPKFTYYCDKVCENAGAL